MNFYANLKIWKKLFFGFAAVVLITFAVGIFGFFQIRLLDSSDDFLFEKGVKPAEYIGDIATGFQRLRVNIRELVSAKGPSKKAYYEGRTRVFRAQIDSIMKKLEASLPNAESKSLFAKLQQTRDNFTPHINRVVRLANVDGDEYAQSYLQSDTVADAERAEITAIENLQEYLIANAQKISDENTMNANNTSMVMLVLSFGAALLAVLMGVMITRSIAVPLRIVLNAITSQQEGARERVRLVEAIAGGDLTQQVVIAEPLNVDVDQIGRDETGFLLKAIVGMSNLQYSLDTAFAKMTSALRTNEQEETLRDWFKNGQSELNVLLRGEKRTAELTEQVLAYLATYLGASVGVFYTFQEKEARLEIAASYAFTRRKRLNEHIALGEGLVGQSARERKMICVYNAPPDYLPISSGIGEAEPVNIVVLPLLYNNALAGVIELGSFRKFTDNDLEFLNTSKEGIAIALNVNQSRQQVNELLEETQAQTEELRVQQEELQQSNEELEERAQVLEQQREQIRAKNREVEEASRETQRKADELERVSTYKSEFLANMSHELRTPLNSLMILSSLLKDNREGNLTDKQVKFASTINGAGRDLLNLINDILDLSKIEAGHVEFYYETLTVQEILQHLETTFHPISAEKGILFNITRDDSAPQHITTDSQRTQQILKNLLSNACKFTSTGSVSLRAYLPHAKENPLSVSSIAFAVVDTGIGIAAEKQTLIFNAFQQADGSTSRTYGGTGLGLSISRQLARSMGGEICVTSVPGKGSTFTLYLPARRTPQTVKSVQSVHTEQSVHTQRQSGSFGSHGSQNTTSGGYDRQSTSSGFAEKLVRLVPDLFPVPVPDDRDCLQDGDRSILIIEDDLTFADILAKLVRDRGFLVIIAADGENGIAMAEHYQPSAIVLDVMLPHIDGWGVMRTLKDQPSTRHIPVHFITCLEERQKAMGMGAVGFVTKPVSSTQLEDVFSTLETAIDKTMKSLLIVEDDEGQAKAMVALLELKDVSITVADTGGKAIALLSTKQFDCIVLDLGMADMGAFELLEELQRIDPNRRIPVIIHTGRELTHDDEKRLHHYAESIIIKGAKSPERLLNEVTLFLHLVETSLDPEKQRMIRASMNKEAMLEGKKILIVDDDMRNIFSLSSALSEKNIVIFEAENGHEALRRLDEIPDIDLVLMDIMMPAMDGYEAMRFIRKDARFLDLPIIALTAKAMKGDRDECIKAGASDYIPKPVDMDKLFSLLRVWLYSADRPDTVEML